MSKSEFKKQLKEIIKNYKIGVISLEQYRFQIAFLEGMHYYNQQ